MLLCEERAPVLKVVYCTYKISYCAMFNYADGSYKNIAGWVFALLWVLASSCFLYYTYLPPFYWSDPTWFLNPSVMAENLQVPTPLVFLVVYCRPSYSTQRRIICRPLLEPIIQRSILQNAYWVKPQSLDNKHIQLNNTADAINKHLAPVTRIICIKTSVSYAKTDLVDMACCNNVYV